MDHLLCSTTCEPETVAIAIGTSWGALVETLLDHGFAVFSINPKQVDRFRDRFTVAGAKDYTRDALVLASSLPASKSVLILAVPRNRVWLIPMSGWPTILSHQLMERLAVLTNGSSSYRRTSFAIDLVFPATSSLLPHGIKLAKRSITLRLRLSLYAFRRISAMPCFHVTCGT